MSDDFRNELAPPSQRNWLLTVGLVAVAGLFFAWFLRELQHPVVREFSHPAVGKALPPLAVEGWLNGPGPTKEELAGKVCVIEAWAFWCRPCLDAAPHTVALHKKHKDRGVVFLGLTSETDAARKQSEEFLAQANMTWPSGYGAEATLAELSETGLPTAWVVNRDGIVVWAGHPLDLSDELLDRVQDGTFGVSKNP